MAAAKKGLGRGLSALIPDSDMDFLSHVARDAAPVRVALPDEASKKVEASEKVEAPQDAPSHRTQRREDSVTRSDSTAAGTISQPFKAGTTPAKASVASINEPIRSPHDDDAAASESKNAADSTRAESTANPTSIEWILMTEVEPNPYQPRRSFSRDEMNDLVASIKNHGVLQPILVRPLATTGAGTDEGTDNAAKAGSAKRFQLVAGERRWRAAQEAGLSHIPAICRSVGDRQALELAVIENVQRHDISAIDAALAYRRLADEFELSQESIARRVGKSRSSIANTLRLLDLPAEIRKTIEDGVLSEGHGRAILLASGEGARRAVFRRVLRDKLSVRETERAAQASLAPSDGTESSAAGSSAAGSKRQGEAVASKRANDDDLKRLCLKLQKALGARLQVVSRGRGGRILIEYASPEELERIAREICR